LTANPAGLPWDSIGSLEDISIPEGMGRIPARVVQTRLISQLTSTLDEVGEQELGYRLLSFRYDGKDFKPDDSDYHREPHGMPLWPKAKVKIDAYLADITLLVEATLKDAGQLEYLQRNFASITHTHNIIVDVDFYRDRTHSAVGFHKDSRGTTLFVNRTVTLKRCMAPR
jgi:hypothetical protein